MSNKVSLDLANALAEWEAALAQRDEALEGNFQLRRDVSRLAARLRDKIGQYEALEDRLNLKADEVERMEASRDHYRRRWNSQCDLTRSLRDQIANGVIGYVSSMTETREDSGSAFRHCIVDLPPVDPEAHTLLGKRVRIHVDE